MKVGQELPSFSRLIDQTQITAYAEASGDHNPIHTDTDFAKQIGLPGTIAHGMLTMGILAEAVATWAGGSSQVVSLACRFSKPLLPGQTLTCKGKVIKVDLGGVAVLELEAISSTGHRVLTNGRAQIKVSV